MLKASERPIHADQFLHLLPPPPPTHRPSFVALLKRRDSGGEAVEPGVGCWEDWEAGDFPPSKLSFRLSEVYYSHTLFLPLARSSWPHQETNVPSHPTNTIGEVPPAPSMDRDGTSLKTGETHSLMMSLEGVTEMKLGQSDETKGIDQEITVIAMMLGKETETG